MKKLLITEFATTTIDFSRSYVLVLADGETAADYSAEIAEIEWIQDNDEFAIDNDLTTVEHASDSDLDEYEVVGTDLESINAELEEIAALNERRLAALGGGLLVAARSRCGLTTCRRKR